MQSSGQEYKQKSPYHLCKYLKFINQDYKLSSKIYSILFTLTSIFFYKTKNSKARDPSNAGESSLIHSLLPSSISSFGLLSKGPHTTHLGSPAHTSCHNVLNQPPWLLLGLICTPACPWVEKSKENACVGLWHQLGLT